MTEDKRQTYILLYYTLGTKYLRRASYVGNLSSQKDCNHNFFCSKNVKNDTMLITEMLLTYCMHSRTSCYTKTGPFTFCLLKQTANYKGTKLDRQMD